MYARRMSTREIVGHLRDLYGIEVSPDLISAVTDAVLDEVTTWQARPLEPVYPLMKCRSAIVGENKEALASTSASASTPRARSRVERASRTLAFEVELWPTASARPKRNITPTGKH